MALMLVVVYPAVVNRSLAAAVICPSHSAGHNKPGEVQPGAGVLA